MNHPNSPTIRAPHRHITEATRRDAERRLRSIRGHIDGILKMLDDEQAYCVDILKQVKAVQAALDRVGDTVLRSHLQGCVSDAIKHGEGQAAIEEVMEALKYQR